MLASRLKATRGSTGVRSDRRKPVVGPPISPSERGTRSGVKPQNHTHQDSLTRIVSQQSGHDSRNMTVQKQKELVVVCWLLPRSRQNRLQKNRQLETHPKCCVKADSVSNRNVSTLMLPRSLQAPSEQMLGVVENKGRE